jgi:hypothetical protein
MQGGSSPGITLSPSNASSCPLRDYIMPSIITDSSQESLTQETWDVIQSPLFECAQDQCLGIAFSTLERCGWLKIFQNVSPGMKPMYTSVPLASILSQSKQAIQDSFYVSVKSRRGPSMSDKLFPNECVKAMDSMDIIHELADYCCQ